ncbi:GntR family transcriptional regulator [Streptomyces sp. Isolate_45]|uniref:GntR family transcriptional regulator n=1 Tax=Streptomyces sp. Isolate_45 TaxID=2950111 RepID=UPI002481FDA0|nr:GntR family transcriptional regulator [Streptomyces sp. Isolate_45]MDA5279863.1 GntR family transcriptional regulator [Streptomyces sp. Isolate_45]
MASKWESLVSQLKAQIDAGEYRPGQKLPTVSAMVTAGEGSTTTVHRAYAELEADGYVVMRRRGGTIVRDRTMARIRLSRYSKVMEPGGSRGPWETALAEQGLDGRMAVLAPEILDAPRDVAASLELPEGSQVVRRRRHALIGDEVVQLQDAWYPLGLARQSGLDSPTKIVGGVLGAMANAGIEPTEAEERIRAWVPTPEEAVGLSIGSRVPVIAIERVTRDETGRPLELLRIVGAADRLELIYDGLPLKKRRRPARRPPAGGSNTP